MKNGIAKLKKLCMCDALPEHIENEKWRGVLSNSSSVIHAMEKWQRIKIRDTGFDLRFRMVTNIITFNTEKPTIFALLK